MYLPEAFREDRVEVLHDLIEAHPLGLLVSASDGIEVDPVPFVVDRTAGPLGTLRAHLARANPHCAALRPGGEAVAVFQGPAAYVTPGWYPSKREHGKVVPTWNYAIVEARGPVRIVEDPGWLRDQIETLTRAREAGRAEPWAIADAPAPFVAAMLRGIVGVEIPLATLVGKWKASQNRPAPDRSGVAEGLGADGAAAMAALVRERDPDN